MLEEPVRCTESFAIFQRPQDISTANVLDPPSSFAYMKEFTGQLVAPSRLWAVREWLTQRQRMWVLNWDEFNAFCNVQRGGLQEMCPDDIALNPLYQSLYNGLSVYAQTPFSLVGPYHMLHGGAQGDNMGVWGLKELGSVYSRANAAMMSRALRPESGLPRGPTRRWCPTHPAEPNEHFPKVSFSADRRIFAYSDEGMCHALRVGQKTCLAGGGAVNRAKLQAPHAASRCARAPYSTTRAQLRRRWPPCRRARPIWRWSRCP